MTDFEREQRAACAQAQRAATIAEVLTRGCNGGVTTTDADFGLAIYAFDLCLAAADKLWALATTALQADDWDNNRALSDAAERLMSRANEVRDWAAAHGVHVYDAPRQTFPHLPA